MAPGIVARRAANALITDAAAKLPLLAPHRAPPAPKAPAPAPGFMIMKGLWRYHAIKPS
jgi:hypothetical protein